ncbi:MAG: DUF4105 domain-containing protein [Vulcanimicrobiota bacterium]
MNITASKQQTPQPWSALQRAATDLGTTEEGLRHIDGVRWDIANNPDGSTIEQGIFGDAYINPDKVTDVFLCIKPFTDKPGSLPGHALLKFQFAPDAPVRDSQGNQDSALALSVEVHFKQGQDYDPVGGQEPQPILYQLGTWSDAIEKATVHDRYPLKIYKLKLDQNQKVALLKERLQASLQDHSQDMYHPVTNSCLSTLIDGVNKVVPAHQQIQRTDANGDPEPQATVPLWSPNAFRRYNLLAPGSPEFIPAKPKAWPA